MRPIHSLFSAFLLSGIMAFMTPGSFAQDRSNDRGQYDSRDRVRRVEPGTTIPVRVKESIDVDKGDNRVYTGVIDADVRGENGRIVVPRGSDVELMVRYSPDNDLNVDLESIVVNGQRYAVRTEQKHIGARADDTLVGSIVGAINGGEGRGRAVRIPRDSVVTFRISRPLDVGISDRGETRDGHHYHDWYGDDRR